METETIMASENNKRWVLARWASGAVLLLVPVLAVLLLGSDCLALNRGSGWVDANAFAPEAKPAVKPGVKQAAGDEVVNVQLNVWENTANRTSIHR
jgi:hypothetical protein